MGKENWRLSDILNTPLHRYNPYSTPVYLRSFKKSKFLNFNSSTRDFLSSNTAGVDVDALTEYQNCLNNFNGYNNSNNSNSTPLSCYINRIYKSNISPAFPIKQLKMERKHDSLLQKIINLKEKIRSIPDSFRPLNSVTKTVEKIVDDVKTEKKLYDSQQFIPQKNNLFTNHYFSCNSNNPDATLSTSSKINNFGSNQNIYTTNPFRFNAAPTLKEPLRYTSSVIHKSPTTLFTLNFNSTNNLATDKLNNQISEKWKSSPNLSKLSKYSELFEEEKTTNKSCRDVSASSSNILNVLQQNRAIDQVTSNYREKKYQDEEEQRLCKIKDLEKEVRERTKARMNREILSEEYRRLKLVLEGLILERKPREEPFPELPEDASELIEKAWDTNASLEEIFVKGFSIDIMRKDLLSLSGLEWLNDEIINFYLNLIMERSRQNSELPKVYAFSTFFFSNISSKGYNSVKRWTRKIDIFSFDLLIIPIHLSVHWCVAIVNLKKKCIEYYDSMLGSNERYLELIKEYLEQEHINKKNETLNTSDWRLITQKNIPRQLNGSDCGMFSCKFAEYASRKAEINFTQTHMQYFRRRMVYEICKKKLL